MTSVPDAARPATRTLTLRRGILVIDVVLVVITVTLGVLDGSLGGSAVFLALFAAMAIGLGAIGALIVARQPGNAVGWLFLLSSVGVALSSMCFEYLALSQDRDGLALPGTVLAAWLNTWVMLPVLFAMVILVPLLFPTGHLPSPRWRPVGLLALAGIVSTTIGAATVPGPLAPTGVDNPIGLRPPEPIVAVAGAIDAVAGLVLFSLTVAALVWRYRHGTPRERLQLRWFAYPAALAIICIGFSNIVEAGPLSDVAWIGALVAVTTLPFAVGIAILRHRLFDIDRIISRTVSYAIVTGVLGATFAALVIALDTGLSSLVSGSSLAVAGATLVVSALFQPLRRRIQTAVDRRFDRARYDGDRLLTALGERLRDEVDLTTIRTDVLATVDEAVRPATVVLWLPDRTGTRRWGPVGEVASRAILGLAPGPGMSPASGSPGRVSR
jgi:hypothetical protein